jgi:hypothetical protein
MAVQKLTPENRIFALEEMDKRREQHYRNLTLKVDDMLTNQRQIIDLLAGTKLNGNKGFVNLVETVEKKVDLIKDQVKDMQKDVDNTKFWGRTATGIIVFVIGIIIKAISDNHSN